MGQITEAKVLGAIKELTAMTGEQVAEAGQDVIERYVIGELNAAIGSLKVLQTPAVRDAIVAMAKDAQTPFMRMQAMQMIDFMCGQADCYPPELSLTTAERALDDPSPEVRTAAMNNITLGLPDADRNRVAAAVAKVMGDADADLRQSAALRLRQVTMHLGITTEYWDQTLKPVFAEAAKKHDVPAAEITATADEISQATTDFWKRFGAPKAP